MFKGSVSFCASIRGNGLTFPSLTFDPKEPCIEKVEIEGRKVESESSNRREIASTVYIAGVLTEEMGKAIAVDMNAKALDRLCFRYNIAIEYAQITGHEFSQLNPPPGYHLQANSGEYVRVGEAITLDLGIPPESIKAELERLEYPGERYFALYRSARLSAGRAEEFMHLYNLLLMLLGDYQNVVDAFIMREAPGTPQTPSGNPRAKPGEMETVYTRLRNEFAHVRNGAHLDHTKAQMKDRVGELSNLTKKAIESYG